MEPYEYVYPEEEEKKLTKKPNLAVILAFFLGLCLGVLGGYALGSNSSEALASPGLSFSPLTILILNGTVIVVVLLILIKKGIRRSRSSENPMLDSSAWTKIMALITVGLLLAGFLAFFMMQNLAR